MQADRFAGAAIEVAGLSKRFRFPGIPKQATLKDLVAQRIRVEGHTSVIDALDDVTFSLRWGETMGLIGRNGPGKSTLLRIMAGIMRPDRGEIRANGSIAPLLTLGAGFHPYVSGRENAFLELLMLGVSRAEARTLLARVFEFAELTEFVDAPMRVYSAGMSMRLAFAVAICVDPDILLIDEVLAVGDELFAKKCDDAMKDFHRRGKTIVLATHDAPTILARCDTALWLDNGRVAGYGKADDVVKSYHRHLGVPAAN